MLLDEIDSMVENQKAEEIVKYIQSKESYNIDELEFISYFKRNSDNYFNNEAYSLSGTGGSGINKPNLSSITCLFIASLKKIRIVKVGSENFSGLYGSTNFFNEHGINQLNSERKYYDCFFSYYDINTIWPWRKYYNELLKNSSFRSLSKEYLIYPIRYKHKMSGLLGRSQYDKKIDKKSIEQPYKLSRFWSSFKGVNIDEFVLGENYIDGKMVYSDKDLSKFQIKHISNKDRLKKINQQLVMGNCEDPFWNESMKRSFCLATIEFGLYSNYSEAGEEYHRILQDNLVSELIKNLHKLS